MSVPVNLSIQALNLWLFSGTCRQRDVTVASKQARSAVAGQSRTNIANDDSSMTC